MSGQYFSAWKKPKQVVKIIYPLPLKSGSYKIM